MRRKSAMKKFAERDEHVHRSQREELVCQNLQEDVANVENQKSITETLRERVRKKLKAVKAENLVSLEDSTSIPHRVEFLEKKKLDTRYVKAKEIISDEGFTFFMTTGEENSELTILDENINQKSKENHQNLADLNDQSCPLLDKKEESLLPELLEVKPAEFECKKLQIKKQWEYLFVPSSSPVLHSCKLPKEIMPRVLEDEGFYIPRKPEICKRSYNKMENRLLKEEGRRGWFDESGQIISLPSPIKQSPNVRKKLPIKCGSELKTLYKKAMQPERESRIINKSGYEKQRYQLDLNISSLFFTHHPLFDREHVLAARLLQLYESFKNRQQQNITLLLAEKLKALKNATKIAESNLEASQLSRKTLDDYKWQIRDTKSLYDIEKQKDLSLMHSILKVWKQIKSMRRHQEYTSTSVKLQFQKGLIKKKEGDDYKVELAQDLKRETVLVREDNGHQEHFSEIWRKQKGLLDSTISFESSAELQEIKESIFIPHLTLAAEVTPMFKCPMHEQKRRTKVQKKQYFIKIFYNEKQVSCTSVAHLQLDFKVIFQQTFNIQLLNWPESLRLEIYESAKRKMFLAKIYLPIPDNIVLQRKDVLEQAEFSCDQQVESVNGEVGTNVPFILDENEELYPVMSGKLMYSLSWRVDEGNIPLASILQPINSVSYRIPRNIDEEIATGILWFTDTQKLTEWAKKIKIDPNDPEYSDLMDFILYTRSKEETLPKYFRLEQLQKEFNFVTEKEIKNCKRFQLLQLRNSGQLDSCYCWQIPLFDREIPDTVFQGYESQLKTEVSVTDEDPISAQRISSANFMRKMRKQTIKQLVKIKHRCNLSDIVRDYEEIISMRPTGVYSPAHAMNRRHLLLGKSAYITDPLSEMTVHPFVEVSFQHAVYQTSTADGSHPCWNEELQMDFISPGHDYSFSGLSKIKDNICVNIFDEVILEKHEDTCHKGCSGHFYIRKNWLGSVSFPFSALLEQSKICGTFQVNMPPVLLGYTWSKTYVSPKEESCGQNLKEYAFLTIFATIEPQLSSVEKDSESDKFLDHEDETLLQRAYIFKKSCKAKFPKRRIITSVFDSEGRNVLVTKYIKSLNPPQLLLDIYPDDPNATFDLISRFVSLIPCISDTVDGNDDVDIWVTSEHCISLAAGNKEEHAVLLCNYFLYFDKKAWVLLGTSLLEGKVAYVLTLENGEYFLWNPLNGQCYKPFDAFCPLQSVDCLIDWENVWFNTQRNSSPVDVNFDISKEGFWKQLLPYNYQHKITQTVQPKEILYTPTSKSMVEELQNRIEKTLKNKIMEWRFQQPTRWHRQCTALLRQILPKLELRHRTTVTDKEENELESLLERYWVTGYPIQMPYINLQAISEAVHQTGIHSSEIPNTEFSLAVYIHPYPNNILSVWIYLVSLVCH
ncbi:protein CC2D2B [Alligator sinensis]|uniref:Protein CC2D2B n=1 Tax=Alligator sinensis TaxID=38654 RepID=A0A3Q0HEY7_ALLSI|nr:protein CC2D2B [Alligator sinensis]